MTSAYHDIAADADVHAHEHPHEEVWHVVAGALKPTLGDDASVLRAGEAAIVRAGQRHSARDSTDACDRRGLPGEGIASRDPVAMSVKPGPGAEVRPVRRTVGRAASDHLSWRASAR
jgi:Cupin domain